MTSPFRHNLGLDRYRDRNNAEDATAMSTKKRKVILVYTTLFGAREWYNLPEKDAENFTKACKCKVQNCEITYNNDRLAESDAVIFHARDMPSPEHLRQISASSRPAHQRWVYFISENPMNTPDRTPLNGLFNWTMTYKKESDIWIPYKKYEKLGPDDPVPKDINYGAQKTAIFNQTLALALWVVSNCNAKRNDLVKKLQDFIPIDVGGGCGYMYKRNVANCNSNGREGCMDRIKKYKFYLSLENTFCDQYVTEKYWYNPLEHDSVPIVLGAGPYDDPKVAIPGSFIDAQKFSSVKELGNYLIHLDKNDKEYNEYFAWKKKYRLTKDVFGWPYPAIWSCEICEKLYRDREQKVYDKLSDFWNYEDCRGKDTKFLEMLSKS
eukprot:gene16765-18459_t